MAPSPPKPKVYRLRGCPAHLDRSGAAALLSRELGDISPTDIQIQSLATNLDPWARPPTRVGTLMFDKLPASIREHDGKTEWSFKVIGLETDLILDTHFMGMTPLNDVEQEKHEFDCIAISGLASHPFGSWQPKGGDKSFMWIRDELPRIIPKTRTSIYGYDTALIGSNSFQSIYDLARSLIDHIRASGWGLPSAKPLIFLAHSLGGIVLKEAFSILAGTDQQDAHILSLFKGGIFFGVPSQGMSTSHLSILVKDQANEQMVQDLSTGSEYLRDLDDQFSGLTLVRNMRLYWSYETKTSPTVTREAGQSFARAGPEEILVSKESATRSLYSSRSPNIFPINENHSAMVKFRVDDPNFRVVADRLGGLCEDSSSRSNDGIRTVAEVPDSALQSHGTIETTGKTYYTQDYMPTVGRTKRKKVEDIMESLSIPDQDYRFGTIDKNFEHTFEWVFDAEKTSLPMWLRDGKDVFWIHGKPGSGKSTLMKFIAKDQRTWEHLHDFSSGAIRIFATFFFHDRGDLLQKSFEGLLRSILYQIIEQAQKSEMDITKIIEPLLKHVPPQQKHAQPWSLNALENLEIFLLLDALDEYDGQPEFICRFLHDLMIMAADSHTRLKILFSSRPWEVFKHQFRNFESIQVQDHTKDDIDNYCWGTFHSTDGRISAALSHIVPKLVLHELTDEALRGKDVDELASTLDSIPSDLKDYYIRTIQRIPENLRWDAYVIFETLSKTRESQSPNELGAVIDCSKQSNYKGCREILIKQEHYLPLQLKKIKPWKLIALWHRKEPDDDDDDDDDKNCTSLGVENSSLLYAERARSGILTSTGNLAEIVTVDKDAYVQFTHQTVKEFVLGPDFKWTILGHKARRTKENGHTFLVKFYLAINLVHTAEPYLFNHEATTGHSLKSFIDSIPNESYRPNNYHIHGPLSLAVCFNLQLYLKETLSCEPDVFRNTKEKLLSVSPKSLYQASKHVNIIRFLFENGYTTKQDQGCLEVMRDDFLNLHGYGTIEMINEKAIIIFSQGQGLNEWIQVSSESSLRGLSRLFRQRHPHYVKTIHQACTENSIRYMLDNGIQVNEPDSLGNTPLDCIIQHGFTEGLERGGIITNTPKEQWSAFLDIFKRRDLYTAILEERFGHLQFKQSTKEKARELLNRLQR
ncbi:hypothetical protein F4781DRAFT_424824 [Annulohypoxylon bovei var. microspora]|nr:hypothetical protein F4781DRAFT_424824 [Annulohypoxylon bovei var. microspora]